MTTANLMNVPSVKGNVPVQVDASKKLQEENLEVAEIFAGLMNQTIEIPNSVVDDTSSNMDVSKTNSTQSPMETYERYSYKEKQIDTAKESSVQEQLEESGEVLEEAGQEVIDTLCEEYGVEEEVIQKLLDDMGLSVLDLLNPQNLVSFIVQLTGVATGEELLLDENFLSVMETINHMAEDLMNELNVDREGLQALVAEMELVTENVDSFNQVIESAMNTILPEGTDATTEKIPTTESSSTEETLLTSENEGKTEVEIQTKKETEVEANKLSAEGDTQTVKETESTTEEVVEEQPETKKESGVDAQVEEQDAPTETKIQMNDAQDTKGGQQRGENFNANESIVQTQTTSNVSQILDGLTTQSFNSYLSADTVQIMEQIVQRMRVTISNEVTTMEMQMNPENLGKVYVNISSEEGVVNAQFRATNEVVKEALEAQVATLRESLNQAGVKVDAIEVTIASHEFERNLEQNQQSPEEQMYAQEEKTKRRRNLNLDSLDELSGMMTEEEALVAQIMKDNGNSVDFTA